MENGNRLIRVGKAVHDMCKACSVAAPGIECKPKHCSLVDAQRNIPAVDAVEVVHGRWEQTERKGQYGLKFCDTVCSNCRIEAEELTNGCGMLLLSEYCPHCGAKMDL